LVLQRKGFGVVEGAWVPNWQFDAICMADDLAAELSDALSVTLRPVRWHGCAPGDATQIVAPTFGTRWFDPDELGAAAAARHGSAGARCQDCGVWRWLPLTLRDAPPLRVDLANAPGPVIASPEWFGDGWNAFRLLLVRRDLADLLADRSPRDFAQP
jgi:hypothetical protein